MQTFVCNFSFSVMYPVVFIFKEENEADIESELVVSPNFY